MGLLNIGASGLSAAYTQLQITGHNIANVNTPNYHRQGAELVASPGVQTGAGVVGRGVDVATVTRSYDAFLERELSLQQASVSGDTARADQLARLDKLFADPASGLGVALDDFAASLADLASRPADPSVRTVAFRRADALAQRISGIDAQLTQVSQQADLQLAAGAQQLDGLLAQVASLNGRIAQQSGNGQPPNDLLDERDRLVNEVNKLVRASSTVQADGSVSLYSGTGQALVTGTQASTLATTADPRDPTRSQLVLRTVNGDVPIDGAALGGGSLAGLLQFRDDDLASIRSRLGQIAGALAGAMNAAQAGGIDATGAPGQPMFAPNPPAAIGWAGNAGSARLSVAVTDATQLAASDYVASFDGSAWTITRDADGATVANGVTLPHTVDGLSISVASGSASAGDRYSVQSASTMARDFTMSLSSPSRLAAALPVTAQTGASNAGDVRVASLAVTDPANVNLASNVTLTFTAPGTYTISGPGIGTLTGQAYVPGQAIAGNGWSLALSGTPAAGDTVAVSATASTATDNRNARAMVDALQSGLAQGKPLGDAWADVLADIGTRAQAANTSKGASEQLLADAKASRDGLSGVNLDEEAARMLQFQQMYQASAKVIATAQNVFDALMQAVHG